MSVILREIYDFAMSMCVELFFVACFALGFSLIRIKGAKFHKAIHKPTSKARQYFKVLQAEASSGNPAKAVAAWRSSKAQEASSCEILKIAAEAFLDSEPDALVDEIADHLAGHALNANELFKSGVCVLEVVAKAGNEEIMESLIESFTTKLHIPVGSHMQEIMLGGHATAGNKEKVAKLTKAMRQSRVKVTARGYSLTIKGFLKNGMLDAALRQIDEMHNEGWSVPSFAVTELFRVAKGCHKTAEVFHHVADKIATTADAAAIILEDCVALQDLPLAKEVENRARQAKVQLTFPACENLLRLLIGARDMHALELFEQMQQSFSYFSDGLCVSLISRCAQSKFVRFAEAVLAFQRSRDKTSIVLYSALMKVYSHCNMYKEACDLYDQILADGLEPDSIMYGCLMKFSAECGRTDLTRKLFSKASAHDIHHHMAMIRAAGQDKDVDKAFAILDDMKSRGVALDTFACNSVLDVCSSTGNMQRARGLVAEMRQQGIFDMISYNTLLKGCASCGDVRRAKEVMAEMVEVGLEPNDISYNCIINMAATAGDFEAAWETIQTMERKSVPIDHYTVSTMMKALKRSQASRDSLGKVMSLLDRHGIDVCCEEVLLNTAIEACIKHNEQKRISNILAAVEAKQSKMTFAPHTYGSLIRASSLLKRVKQCQELWRDMTEVRGLEPSGVTLGCMLDALACSGRVAEAVALLRKWQDRVTPNTVIYSTLIKGFVNNRDRKRADEMWHELLAKELPLNTVVYNAIIDAHAREGDVDRVAALVASMESAGCQPDDITWSMVAKGYCVVGEVEKALEVFTNLKSESNGNTVIMFNTILDGCVRHNRPDLADHMLKNMVGWKVRPTNFTLGIIVKMCGRRGQLNRAFEALKTLPEQYGFTPNGPVHTCLFFACLRNDALDDAIHVLHEHRASGNPADCKMITALVNNCARAGKIEEAVALVEDTFGLKQGTRRQIAFNEDLEFSCLEQLMKALTRRGLMQKVGVPLVKKMKAAKVGHSSRLVTMCLTDGQQL